MSNENYEIEFEKFKQQARLFNLTEEELKSDFGKLQFQINFKKIEKIIRRKKKNLTNLSARSAGTQIGEIKKKMD